jgi:hypothetical protein
MRIRITITHANGATEPRSFGTPAELDAFDRDCKAGLIDARWAYDVGTEPTEQGLQYIMPGCEKDRARGPKQSDLF